MNTENTNKLFSLAIELNQPARRRKLTDKQISDQIQQILLKPDEYNGWINYETWNMHLILTNKQNLYNEVNDLIQTNINDNTPENLQFKDLPESNRNDILYNTGQLLQEYIQNTYSKEINDVTIYIVDCEAWTTRDLQEIEWTEIVKAFIEE